MPKTVPTPLAAALGLVPTAIDTARRIPARVIQLPVLAISTALSRWAEAQQRYDELAERGERFVAQVRGRSHEFDEMEIEEWLAEPVPTEDHDVVAQVSDLLDKAASRKTADTPEAAPGNDEQPLPDYDHMTLGSLRGRLRTLTVEQLITVRDYEKTHADRLPVITLLENRIAKLGLTGTEPTTG